MITCIRKHINNARGYLIVKVKTAVCCKYLLRTILSLALILLLLVAAMATPQRGTTRRKQPGKSTSTKPAVNKDDSGPANSSPAGATPTLEETLSWISSKLKAPDLTEFFTEKEGKTDYNAEIAVSYSLTYKVIAVSYNKCTLTLETEGIVDKNITYEYKSNLSSSFSSHITRDVSHYEFDYSTLNNVTTERVLDIGKIWLAYTGNRKLEKEIYKLNANGIAKYTFKLSSIFNGGPIIENNRNGTSSGLGLYIEDKDLADRIKKAFEHAGKLCRKKEPF